MLYDNIKKFIADLGQTTEVSTTAILKGTNSLVNNKSTSNQGRDLVIRILAKLEMFSESEKEFIISMVRSVGLFPYISNHQGRLPDIDRLAYEVHRAPYLKDEVVFHSLQAKIYGLLMSGRNVILSAATSVGKSLVIDTIVAARKFKKIVIVVPTIALIDETRRRLSKKFSEHCAVITHPSQKQHEGKLNIYVLTQERVLQREDLVDVDFFVIDEFYKLDLSSDKDINRAIDLNLAFHKLISNNAQFYLLGPNIQAITGLEKHEFVFVPSDFTTVAVDFIPFNLPYRGDERPDKLVELCQELKSPTIIYCQSPASANVVANILIDKVNLPLSGTTEGVSEWIENNFHAEWDACRAIKYGIGIHHGGIPRALQQHFIRLFNEKRIKFLICTSTIIEGVNTSAENVIIYDRRKGGNAVIDYFTYKNISGRAGRMGHYFVGKVFMLEEAPEDTDYTVNFAIGTQAETTPLGLLMELDPESLSELSKSRLDSAYKSALLSKETLVANRHISIENQIAIAETILADVQGYRRLLSWRSLPSGPELEAVCTLIYDHLLGSTLKDYNIHSGASLAWHINFLRIQKDLSLYLQHAVTNRREDQSISNAVNNSLRFIRNMICYRIPRDLMAVSRIQNEIYSKIRIASGDFTFFATQMESAFTDPLLFALDEYGIPIQISEKFAHSILPAETLDEVLGKLKKIDLRKFQLSQFELQLAKTAIADF